MNDKIITEIKKRGMGYTLDNFPQTRMTSVSPAKLALHIENAMLIGASIALEQSAADMQEANNLNIQTERLRA